MIILAFPGLGKTTLAKSKEGFVDLDYEYIRSAGRGLGLTEEGLIKLYAAMARRYDQDGYVVLLNEPEVLTRLKSDVSAVFIPNGRSCEERCAKKLGVDLKTLWGWQFDWMTSAMEHEIAIVEVNRFLSDHFNPRKKSRK